MKILNVNFKKNDIQEKKMKGKTLRKKIFHSEKPTFIDLPKYFTEILAMRTREQIGVKTSVVMPSSLACEQSGCLFKTTF